MANWLFQANPSRYDVFGDFAAGRPIESWSIGRHRGDLLAGDRVALWVGGQQRPGVYALGHVTGEPFEGRAGAGWLKPEDQGSPRVFCPISLDRLLVDAPIDKEVLRSDPRFAKARILTQPQAANPFRLTDEEWDAIEARAPDPVGVARRSADNVWLEVQHKCRRWMAEGVAVYTLSRNVRNFITGVSDTRIERRSDEGRRDGAHTAISKTSIVAIWTALESQGYAEHTPRALRFAYALVQRAIPGVGFEPTPFRLVVRDRAEAFRAFSPTQDMEPTTGALRRNGAGGARGGGGEGELHKALKEYVKTDPLAAIGERLTYESEDLTEVLGSEVRFITGDKVDLLMKDEQGDYVVIEIEPEVGPDGQIGFHQAGKYRVLIAMEKGLPVERVRAIVVATKIDPALSRRYSRLYGIEARETMPPRR